MNIDLSPLVSALAPLALATVTACAPMAVAALMRRLGQSKNSELNARLVAALDAGAGEAYRQAVLHGHDLTIPAGQNAAVAIAANYVLGRLPDTLKQLGVTPSAVADMSGARLGKLLAADPTVSTKADVPAPIAPPEQAPSADAVGRPASPAPAPTPAATA